MRMRWFLVMFLILGCCYNADAQDSLTDLAVPSFLSLPKSIKVNTFAQVGFQWIGSNATLPPTVESIPLPPPFSLTLGDAEWKLEDANFWSGTAGLTILADDLFSVFAAVGGILDRPFSTSGETPVTFTGVSASNYLQWSCTNVDSWFVQGGVGVGPIIGGLYFSHFGFSLSDPRNRVGPLADQTLRGDVLTKSWCPCIGISIPTGGAVATVIYSPLAYSKATLAVRNFLNGVSETEYKWNKPGDFILASFQYNTPLTSAVSFGIWANYSWMSIRGDGEVAFRSSAFPAPIGRAVTVSMSQYVCGGGLTLGYNF